MAIKRKPTGSAVRGQEIMTAETLDAWRSLYGTIKKFVAKSPWDFLSNIDVFVVKDPQDNQTYLCGTIVAGDTEFGLNAYRGDAGMRIFYKMLETSDTELELSTRLIYETDMLSFSLADKSQLHQFDVDVLRKLILAFRGGQWPLLESYRPHFVPWRLNISEVKALQTCLEQTMYLTGEFGIHTPDELRAGEPGQLLVRAFENGAWHSHFVNQAYLSRDLAPEVRLDDITIQRLKSKPISTKKFELDLVHLPVPVADHVPPYFPLLVVASDTRKIFPADEMIAPTSAASADIYEQAMHKTAEILLKMTKQPARVLLRESTFADTMIPMLTAAGIAFECTDRLPGIDEFVAMTEAHFKEC